MTDQHLLTVDAGNTRTKWGVFDDAGTLIAYGALLNVELKQSLETVPPAWGNCRRAIVSNVAGGEVRTVLQSAFDLAAIPPSFITSTASACKVINGYEAPQALGTDRWAALIAAWNVYHLPSVVVNAGTALTVDTLATDSPGQARFLGGVITPGLWLMQDKLVNNTAGISTHSGELQDFPTSTANAVYNGALSAMAGTVKSMLAKLQVHQPGPLQCIITGGDAALLAQVLQVELGDDVTVNIVEHLVLQGLQIMEKNSAKDGMQKGEAA